MGIKSCYVYSFWSFIRICICYCICLCVCFPICFCYCICLCVCLFTGQVMFYLLITWIKCLKGHKFQRLLLGYPNCRNYQMPHLSMLQWAHQGSYVWERNRYLTNPICKSCLILYPSSYTSYISDQIYLPSPLNIVNYFFSDIIHFYYSFAEHTHTPPHPPPLT